MMSKPDDTVDKSLRAIDKILSASPIDLSDLKSRLVSLLSYLCSPNGRTDANCRAVDIHFCIDIDDAWPDLELPPDFAALFDDIGGALHDTISFPKV